MKLGRILVVGLVVGVAVNFFDFLYHGLLMAGRYEGMAIMRQDGSMVALVLGDIVAAIVFVWVFARVKKCFDAGVIGGVTFGVYAGVLTAFPMFIFNHLLLVDYTYGLAWSMTIAQILWCLVAGAVAGAMIGRGEPAAA